MRPVLLALVLLAFPFVAAGQDDPTRKRNKPLDPAIAEGELGEGFTIHDPEERFGLTLRARIQARAQFVQPAPDESLSTEFLIRRMRLLMSGYVLSRQFGYYIQLGFSERDMESDLRVPLRDAYIVWNGTRDFKLRLGQMKVPYGRQRVISSSALEFVDRSIVTAELNLDRDVGLSAFSEDLFGLGGTLAYTVGVFGGDGRNRTQLIPGVLTVGRLEWNPFGRFPTRSEGDLERSPTPRLAIGMGAAYNANTNRPRSTIGTPLRFGTFDYVHAGTDLIFRWHGFSLQTEWLGRWVVSPARRDENGQTVYARPAMGAYGQASQMLSKHLQVAARFGEFWQLGDVNPDFDRERELGGAMSWYLEEHALKVQGDYFWLTGERFGEGRHQVRIQMQLYF